MTEVIEDRRIRKTKARIRQALTQLLMKRDLKDISVKELTDLADINRGTFYLHYKDAYDLFEQTENDILESFTAIISKHRRRAQMPLMPVLLETFRFVEANSQAFIAILRTKETTFLPRVVEMCRPQDPRKWEALVGEVRPEEWEYHYAFIAFGCIALLRLWFENGMTESAESMAALAERLCAARKQSQVPR